jgi:hypothetical protein
MPPRTKFSDSLGRSPESACCTVLENGRSLILTQVDGATEGFPLTWLYRWQWKKEPTDEVLILTLSEHEVIIRGKNLEEPLEALGKNTGLQLRAKEERYQSLVQPHETLIYCITVRPTATALTQPMPADQS